jgi:hypothetical protein
MKYFVIRPVITLAKLATANRKTKMRKQHDLSPLQESHQ